MVPQILARALGLSIRVHQMNHSYHIGPPTGPDTAPIHVMLHNNHYQNLTPQNGSAPPATDWNALAFTSPINQTALDAEVNHYRNQLQHNIRTAEQQITDPNRHLLRTRFDTTLRNIELTRLPPNQATAHELAAHANYLLSLSQTKHAWTDKNPHPTLTDSYTITTHVNPTGRLTFHLNGTPPYVGRHQPTRR